MYNMSVTEAIKIELAVGGHFAVSHEVAEGEIMKICVLR